MWGFTVHWHADRPLEDSRRNYMDVDQKTFMPERNMGNDYLKDVDKQHNVNWTGVDGIRTQDMMVQEDQDGPICRRWEEHLGTTDRGMARCGPKARACSSPARRQNSAIGWPSSFSVR